MGCSAAGRRGEDISDGLLAGMQCTRREPQSASASCQAAVLV